MGGNTNATCGFLELVVFIGALIAGTGCSLTSKVMLSMKSVGMTGETEAFSYPLFQTFGMFLGMTAGLFMHWIVTFFKIPFPGYNHQTSKGEYGEINKDPIEPPKAMPYWMYFLLIIPSIFDLVATALCMFGLRYVNVSIYQMLRGAAIVFVAILKQFALGDRLHRFQWIGVFWNVVSIVLVGVTALFSVSSDNSSEGGESQSENNPMIGVLLILSGAFVQSLQYAFEERVMSMDIPAPPLFLIGMEGLWGSLLCLCILYPAAYHLPGNDHGSIENPFNTLAMIQNSRDIQFMFGCYFVSIFLYNMLACLVTKMLNSVWHAILDNFRPITVWTTDLFIFYVITTSFGESWSVWSYLQLLGLFVLLYGTAIYNAPNAGSILLKGDAYSCGIDCSEEYAQIEDEQDDKAPPNSPYMHTMSPFLSPTSRGTRQKTGAGGGGGGDQRKDWVWSGPRIWIDLGEHEKAWKFQIKLI